MQCDTEILQAYLDRELAPPAADELRRHLALCPACRRELSRLRLIWLELEQEEEIEIPFELPFLRQQVIASSRKARQKAKESATIGLRGAQRLVWQPAMIGVSRIPGPRQLAQLARITGNALPAAIKGVSFIVGTLTGRRKNRS